jgi:leucyl-tRNA synthetase
MYNHKEIDAKWQTRWQESKLYATAEDPKKPKQYILDMFPYPSGEGLHVGHPKGYIATDVVSRMRMMQGYNVLHPIGWDAFGLPTENYAIKNKVHPRIATEKNIARFKHQLQMIGFTYDWDREINTTDPKFYRWTQWCFLQMFEKGLAYESYEPINWCPSCKTGLANEDLEDGRCERCGSEIEQKPVRQWVLKITAYAERLLNDLDKLPHWEQSIKDMQRAWIGKSEGAEINFRLTNSDSMLTVFTTRIDTIFGCTYVVIAPEHPLLVNEEICVTNADAVKEYIEETKKKTNLQRAESKEKNGVHLEGIAAINPFTHEEVPIFVADYVIGEYGTGAVMAVPAHDERDFEFAKKHQLPLRKVIVLPEVMSIPRNAEDIAAGATCVLRVESECYTGDGELINSNEFSGLPSAKAREKMISWLETEQCGTRKVNYKIRDWVFSRQRYWGEPIPIIHCDHCGAIPVPLDKLPVLLPEVEHYEPTGTGESPLAAISEWVNTSCPSCKGPGKRETNTMPQWAGSSWYYLRYIDPQNSEQLVDSEKEKYWSPVDLYVGGAEHATRHLIYARFWHKFLYDHGVVNYDEPFMRLKNVGLIMGEDGLKMSKRWGNVVNPDDVVERLGADALRVYEMFMGPFSQAIAWNTNGLAGSRRFLEKVWRMRERVSSTSESSHLTRKTHQTIRKVSEDIEEFRFNTAVSSLMILANEMEKSDRIALRSLRDAPRAVRTPHGRGTLGADGTYRQHLRGTMALL